LTLTLPQLEAVSINPATVVGGTPCTGTVTLTGPAHTGGIVIHLKTSSKNAFPPPTVFVPAGKSAANFTLRTTAVPSEVQATVSATLGTTVQIAGYTLLAPPLVSMTLNPTTVVGGRSVTGTVRIASPAPVGGLGVAVTSDSWDAVIAGGVKIPGGQTSVTFTIKTLKVTWKTIVIISASENATYANAALTITGT